MTWQVNDVFSLVLESRYPSNVVGFNQLFYQLTQWDGVTPPPTTASEQLANEFVSYVGNFWRSANWNATRLSAIRVFDLFDPTDVFEEAIAIEGEQALASDALPPYVAVRCSALVARRFRRDVSNRFSGLPEAWQSGGVFAPPAEVGAAWLALADALVSGLTAVYSGSESLVFRRVAIRRVKVVEDGKTKYNLPQTLSEADPVIISQGRLNNVLTTQGGRRL